MKAPKAPRVAAMTRGVLARRCLRIGLGKARRPEQPIYERKTWPWLPYWISLHAERGAVWKCWFGHRLARTTQDGRKHRACVFCEQKAGKGEPIRACPKCPWVVCSACEGRPRLSPLADDPLFHGPDSPALLPPTGIKQPSSRGTVIICPGGNYEFLVPHEGLPAAEWLAASGVRSLVLRYRHLPAYSLDDMLEDLRDAAAIVKQTYGGPVAAMGFSAGGHLVASLALEGHGVGAKSKRPLDAQVLVYPCIDGSDWVDPESCGFHDFEKSFPKAQSLMKGREALLGGRGFAAPPTFMVASTADEASPPKEHTDKYARALRRAAVPYVYMRRDFGPHGFGLEGGWTGKCLGWLLQRGFGAAPPVGAAAAAGNKA
uniref:Alpha/beta hydrolase fold-3 domain-containing protein n=1 Tax=Alexandrium catenella TaxID=2925 RepID=A0A7S1S3V0_ALECA